VIYLGIDDTDTLDTPGTNQLARAIVASLAVRFRCKLIVRHQLLDDPRVPCTSKNGSASILLTPIAGSELNCIAELLDAVRQRMRQWYVPGSDPGFCVAREVPGDIQEFGRRCKVELVDQAAARQLARHWGIHLEGLGGTEGGVIGALAAVGLAATENDGRVVQIGTWPDDLTGWQDATSLHERGVAVARLDTHQPINSDMVDVGKHLRPNRRAGRIVLFVEPHGEPSNGVSAWRAARLT
jgi:tRNA(Ile2) C34 agmatinyltransferase TiaS